jgi:hypothetical protein
MVKKFVRRRPKPKPKPKPKQERTEARALVVFSDGGNHPLSRFLKPGFGHCFVCLRTGDYWIKVDGREGVPEFEVLTLGTFDLAAFYRDNGYTVVETEPGSSPIRGPFIPANCVGLVRAALSLRTWALTPFQLFKFLTRAPMQILPGFDSPAPPPAPPPPPTQTDPAIKDSQDKLRQSELRRKGRAATLLTPPDQNGLGDANLSRPQARAAKLLGD